MQSINHKTEIYCDMDGVLVDFVTGALKLCSLILDFNSNSNGKFVQEVILKSKTIRSSIKEIIDSYGKEWRPGTDKDLDIPSVKRLMFATISYFPGDFFENLLPLKDGTELLWKYLNSTKLKLKLKVNILSAPIHARKFSGCVKTAAVGKKTWVKRWLKTAPSSVIIVPAREKQKFAISEDGTPNILIDDRSETIDSWNSRGGIGILHIPHDSDSTIKILKEKLEK